MNSGARTTSSNSNRASSTTTSLLRVIVLVSEMVFSIFLWLANRNDKFVHTLKMHFQNSWRPPDFEARQNRIGMLQKKVEEHRREYKKYCDYVAQYGGEAEEMWLANYLLNVLKLKSLIGVRNFRLQRSVTFTIHWTNKIWFNLNSRRWLFTAARHKRLKAIKHIRNLTTTPFSQD